MKIIKQSAKINRILVTGGTGFLGKHIVNKLQIQNYEVVSVGSEYDLRITETAFKLILKYKPDAILHLAAKCGGIGANIKRPGEFFRDNMLMGINIIDAACHYGVEKIVFLGSVCSYPKNAPLPFKEKNLWDEYPEITNAPYGVAKKSLLIMLQAYREQYDLNGVYLIPVNLYGPGDRFDLENSHVIPALIRKFYEAKLTGERSVELWGTGNACREFLYVKDAAKGIVDAMEKYDGREPVNLGTGHEISIRDLAMVIKTKIGFDGEIKWNTQMPDGQPRRCLDVSKAKEYFGFQAETPLDCGIGKTIKWYINHRDELLGD